MRFSHGKALGLEGHSRLWSRASEAAQRLAVRTTALHPYPSVVLHSCLSVASKDVRGNLALFQGVPGQVQAVCGEVLEESRPLRQERP